MSSEGSDTISSGSRIRQFGLYRTIDARTEEFLRLSRKRQIKQGCACAAVSTAITVTVVISVLLVYEYSINAGSNSSKILRLKSNWYGLLNNTSDATGLDTKFSQKKMNFDSTTLKLLPVLLKALNQNRYLEKIIDDYSSSSPPYEKTKSTEFSFKKNIFINERWAKMPIYTLVYKTTPLLNYKSPTKTSEYYTKIRKIRDYQRMLNYFDKMISEKVKYSTSLSNDKIKDVSSESAKTVTKPMPKYEKKTTLRKTQARKKVITKHDKNRTHCKCPKNMSDLLQKVISSIKLIMLDKETSKSPCQEVTKSETLNFYPLDKSVKVDFAINNIERWPFTSEKPNVVSEIKPYSIYKTTSLKNGNGKKNYVSSRKQSRVKPNIFQTNVVNYPMVENKNIFESFFKRYEIKKSNIKDYNGTTSTERNAPIVTTTSKDFQKIDSNATKTTVPTKNEDEKVILFTVKEEENNMTKPKKLVPVFSDLQYDDYFSSTPKVDNNIGIDFDNLDVHSVELVKSKIIPERKNKTNLSSIEHTKPVDDYDTSENKNSSLYFVDKMVTVIFPTINSKIQNDSRFKTESINERNKSTDSNISQIKTNAPNKTIISQYQYETTVPEEDVDKVVPDEELQEAEATKQVFNSNNTTTSGIEKSINIHDILKTTGESKKYTSMLPANRPVYLEVNRNDWRHDEHQDFDINLNKDNFDFSHLVK